MCRRRRHGGSFVLVSVHRPPVAPWRASAGGGVVAADRRSRHRLSSDSAQGAGPYRAGVPPVRAVAPLLVLCALAFAGEVSSEPQPRSDEHTSELQSLMRISYAVFCLKKK